MTVHILATCRNPDLLPATLLVFKTLRIGFPTAEVFVTINTTTFRGTGIGLGVEEIENAAKSVLCNTALESTNHHAWITRLITFEAEPLYILDTDLVFWESFERFDFSGCAMAGRYVPQFDCSFVKAITRPRLHTCLLYLDPQRIKAEVAKYASQFPEIYCCPRPTLQDLVFPRYTPYRLGKLTKQYFSDTCSQLFAAIGGKLFTEEQNLAFDHAQHGTLTDLVGPNYPSGSMLEFQATVMDQPHLLKGQWRREFEFYRHRYAE